MWFWFHGNVVPILQNENLSFKHPLTQTENQIGLRNGLGISSELKTNQHQK